MSQWRSLAVQYLYALGTSSASCIDLLQTSFRDGNMLNSQVVVARRHQNSRRFLLLHLPDHHPVGDGKRMRGGGRGFSGIPEP